MKPKVWVSAKTDEEQNAKRSTYYMVHAFDACEGRWYREPERYRELSHATTAARAMPRYKNGVKIFKVTEEEVEKWK